MTEENQRRRYPMTVRTVELQLEEDAYEQLDRLARSQNKSLTDLLAEALRLETFVLNTRRAGGKILVREPNGETREVFSV